MGSFFSSSKKSKVNPEDSQAGNQKAKVSDKDRAQLELKRTRDKLRKNQVTTRNVIARESQLARELLDKGMRQRAITVLKKKKYQETLLERAEKNLLNVEQMMLDIDSAVEMKKVFDSLALGSSCLKALQDEISIDSIDQLMEDTAEALQLHEEMSNSLASNITSQDMTELEDEVQRMMQEMEEEEEREKQESLAKQNVEKKPEQVAETHQESIEEPEDETVEVVEVVEVEKVEVEKVVEQEIAPVKKPKVKAKSTKQVVMA